MKNFSKQQISIIIISSICVLIMAYLLITIKQDTDSSRISEIYKLSKDSVLITDTIITKFSKAEAQKIRDIFNFKIIEKKKIDVVHETDNTPQIQYSWINTNELELYTRDVVSFSLFFDGKARFSINGKTQEFKVGDKIAIGKKIQKQVVSGTNQSTGNTRTGSEYLGDILSITERSVYVNTEDKNRVVRFRPGIDGDYYARNLMEATSGQENQDTPQGGDVPGRRIPRPGR
ncbi:MAG: hypothetical protein JXR69_11125 [Candidatus Delongbacteria bacterium]|nr:hypothetical protein [Candidatus Delongbacteria bacterium]